MVDDLLLYLDYFKLSIIITGIKDFEPDKLEKVMKDGFDGNKEVIQFFDASCVAGINHLLFSSVNALKALENNTSISKKLAVEILLRASGQRQIKKAISMMGVKLETRSIVLVLLGKDKSLLMDLLDSLSRILGAKTDDSLITLFNREKLDKLARLYEITPLEIEAKGYGLRDSSVLEELIIERGAMLGIKHD
jgi:tRNA threonylcarbamoyladenosine modification (KEOPS) complex Cgi121 subunit